MLTQASLSVGLGYKSETYSFEEGVYFPNIDVTLPMMLPVSPEPAPPPPVSRPSIWLASVAGSLSLTSASRCSTAPLACSGEMPTFWEGPQ